MFKISFLLILLGLDSRYPCANHIVYEKSSTIRTKRSAAVGARERIPPRREALLQDEVLLALLLKASGLSATEVGERAEMEQHTVKKWLKRYEKEGVKGLETRPGRGRKPIMDSSDEEAVHRAIEEDRQSVNRARESWQQSSGKEAGESTFKRFLSALAQDISV